MTSQIQHPDDPILANVRMHNFISSFLFIGLLMAYMSESEGEAGAMHVVCVFLGSVVLWAMNVTVGERQLRRGPAWFWSITTSNALIMAGFGWFAYIALWYAYEETGETTLTTTTLATASLVLWRGLRGLYGGAVIRISAELS